MQEIVVVLVTIGSIKRTDRVLMANIEDKAILRTDLMSCYSFQVDLRQRLLKIDEDREAFIEVELA